MLGSGFIEDDRCIDVIGIPPLQKGPGPIAGRPLGNESGWTEFWLVGERRCRPLDCARDDRQDDEDLFAEERGGFIPASVRTRLNVLEACPLNVPELAYAG